MVGVHEQELSAFGSRQAEGSASCFKEKAGFSFSLSLSRFHGTVKPTAVETNVWRAGATLQYLLCVRACVCCGGVALGAREGRCGSSFVQHNAQSTWTANDVQVGTLEIPSFLPRLE